MPNRNQRRQRRRNRQGFIDAYNAGNGSAPDYGTPQYQQQYDPTQPFGTPQQPGPRVPDWAETQATIGANRNVALSNAQALYDRGRITRDFGYQADGSIDPNNPFSLANQLERSYAQGQRGDNTSFAAQGQLYSGAYQNQINARTREHSQGVNDLRNRYNDSLNNVSLQQLGTYANSGSAVSDASFQTLLAALGGR